MDSYSPEPFKNSLVLVFHPPCCLELVYVITGHFYRPLVLIQTALWLFWEERTLISFNFTYFPCLLITERCNPQAFYVILARESPHEKRCFKLNRYTVSSPLNFIKHRHCSILSPGVQQPERRELIVRTGRIQCRTSIWLWLSLMSAI